MKKRMHPLVWVFMSGLVFYFIITLIQQQSEISMIRAQMQVLQQKINQEEKKREELLEHKIEANTDAFIESIAREKLGMVKEGERLFVDTN
jgi:cell division protein FtsB